MAQDVSRGPRLGGCFGLILWIALVGAPAEAQEGFSSHGGELVRYRLAVDGSDVVPVEVGELEVAGYLVAMALGPDGRLYAVSWDWGDRLNRLYVIDPETADATLVGELVDLPDRSAYDMTFDDEGRLWLLAQGEDSGILYRIDPQTAAATEIAAGLVGLHTLAFHDGAFYGIVFEIVTSEFTLVSIDPATGDLTSIVELTDLEEGPWCVVFPSDMSFDDAGRLWVAADWWQGCITIPYPMTGFHFYADPFDGVLTSRSRVAGALLLNAFAVRGPVPPVVDVPTLGFGGGLILAVALAAAALIRVRRRR